MQLKEILSKLPIYESRNLVEKTMIKGIKMDHREVNKGDLFVCIKGFTVDGHQFAEQAVARGAVAVVAEKEVDVSVSTIVVPNTTRALALLAAVFYRYPTQKLTLVGITGTNGKTTTSYMLEKIFQKNKQKTGLIGTIQMKIGNESRPIKNTTPDALTLQQVFAKMVEAEVEVAIMEVSSHALDLGRVYGCDFKVAVFSNLTQDHLDYHENMEQYLRAKTLLFTGLGSAYNENEKYAILNADDPASEKIAKHTAQPIITYGINHHADIRAEAIEHKLNYTTFRVVTPRGKLHIKSHLIGTFNVYNMLSAIAVGYTQKIPLQMMKEALEEITGVAGRFERVDMGQDFAVIVDYAHTPDSLENVLQTIKEFSEKNIYVVAGSGGDRDRTKRPLMAEVALKYSDWAIFTSDNPRTEDPRAILDDMTKNISKTNYEVIVDRREAISHAISKADTGDVVLIAGKGHETYQEINGVRYDFDDREEAKLALKKKGIN